MNFVYNPIFNAHDTGMHPENKKRLNAFRDFEQANLPFDESILELVHTKEYVRTVKKACIDGTALDLNTHISPDSYKAAVYAANATIEASRTMALAIVRPPGHHAHCDQASGFCIFNNIAIASQILVNHGKRVLIFDFDGHLGDGTTDIFYESDQVMYWSIHQYPGFPNRGLPNEIGKREGKGYTINVPIPPGSGDDIFMDAFLSTLPIALQFEPDIVAVSAGFDAHQYDLLLDLRVTFDSFYEIGRELAHNFSNVFATLEGGYNVEDLPKCMFNFVDGINGKEKKFSESPNDSDIKIWSEYEIWLHQLLSSIASYWKI